MLMLFNFDASTVVTVQIVVFWVLTPFSLEDGYHCFRRARLHDFTPNKATISILVLQMTS
jgi:hypothetical protein